MDTEQNADKNLTIIKDKLNQNKVKLWLSPFYTETNGSNDEEMRELARKYSTELSIPIEVCVDCLQKLQNKALENLRERSNYESTGKAALKVRLPNEQGIGKTITTCIELSKTGHSLKESISQEISVPIERLKLIFQGKILKDEETLESQQLRHGLHLMAIILGGSDDLSKQESYMQLLDATKEDVNLLAKDEEDEDYLQVADQTGKLLKLPHKERKALILAMTLHEKGRAAIKREDFALALVLLLEAEKEFGYCNSALLKSVDNYGVLNLDIVWCYLNLQSVTQLPDAEERLRQCEQSFHQSYGPNLERLIALKGSAGNENALFMRLHLLQAIVLYHQNKFEEAKILLRKAEDELKVLEVDDNQLSHLIELGYGTTEARLALRQSKNDLNAAVNIIENKREEKKKNNEVEERERKLKKEKKKLGKCINGDWIEPEFHKALMTLGYSYEVARWALAQSCNNISTGVNLIQEHPEYLPICNVDVPDNLIAEVINLGFDSKRAKKALQKYGDVNKAVEALILDPDQFDGVSNSSSDSESSDPSTSMRKKEAYSRVSEGLTNCEDDHLDLNLIAESAFIEKYKELISKR